MDYETADRIEGLSPAIAIEPYAGLALQKEARRALFGIGATMNLMPDWAIAPFVHIGGGGMHETPSDEFRLSRDTGKIPEEFRSARGSGTPARHLRRDRARPPMADPLAAAWKGHRVDPC